jgi:lipopolysaccharide transport system permease protein
VQPELVTIRPSPAWRAVNLRELWQYRDLLLVLGVRDIKVRYRQTALGVAWVVLQPLLGAAVFAFVFGRVARLDSGGVPYLLFALVGMVAWGAVSGSLLRANASLVQNPQLISKTFFPRLVLPFSTVLSVVLDLLVGVGLVMAAMALYGVAPSWRIAALPVWLSLLVALGLGLGLFASALTVRFRDVAQVLPVLIQLAFYASPVAYAVTAVPERYRAMVLLNPVAPLLEAVRWSVFGKDALPGGSLAFAGVLTLLTFWAGALFFRHAERAFADVI